MGGDNRGLNAPVYDKKRGHSVGAFNGDISYTQSIPTTIVSLSYQQASYYLLMTG